MLCTGDVDASCKMLGVTVTASVRCQDTNVEGIIGENSKHLLSSTSLVINRCRHCLFMNTLDLRKDEMHAVQNVYTHGIEYVLPFASQKRNFIESQCDCSSRQRRIF